MPLTFRPYTGPKDLDHQYRIWTAATEGLPFAWRSTETNVRYISSHAPKFPGSRLFAERDGPGGEVVGYIGTHDPFQWKTLGMAVPFGFPWTWPRDGALERELYDRMFASTPSVYAGTLPPIMDTPPRLSQRTRLARSLGRSHLDPPRWQDHRHAQVRETHRRPR
jgi:hypothetical protein